MSCTPDVPLKICMGAGHYLPNVGGVERYVYNLSKALLRGGSRVAVVTALPKNAAATETSDGIDIFRLPSLHVGGGRLPVPVTRSPVTRRQIAAIKDWDPDIFVVHTHLFVSNLLVARLAQGLGKPCVLINHGSGYVSGGGAIVNRGLKSYERFLAKRIGRLACSAYGVSLSAAKWLGEFGIHTDAVIANGVDTTALPIRSPAFRERLGISDSTCLIAFAARLLPEKGADTLVSAFRRLNPQNAALAIAGEGPAFASLQAIAAKDDRIHLLGACSHATVLELFGAADIMAYPSRYPEGQPTTVLEAGAMGCAVIATSQGGTAELIDSPDLGLIVKDQAGLESALKRVIHDAPLRQRLGQNLQEKIRRQYDWLAIADAAAVEFDSIHKNFRQVAPRP